VACVSSSGLDCTHWGEVVYAWRHGWFEVVVGLAIASLLIAAGLRFPRLLPLGIGLGVGVVVGFGAYYVSL
jgi:hypothetical protein